jgi:hypothetical protein
MRSEKRSQSPGQDDHQPHVSNPFSPHVTDRFKVTAHKFDPFGYRLPINYTAYLNSLILSYRP